MSIGLAALAVVLYVVLLVFYGDVMLAARSGFELWLNAVMPALFPFMVCTSLMQYSGAIAYVSERLFCARSFLWRLFLLFILFLLCSVAGAPSGARVFGAALDKTTIDKRYAGACIAVCNQFSPMFIAGTLCLFMLDAAWAALPIMIAHYGAALPALIALAFFMPSKSVHIAMSINAPHSAFSMLSKSISDSLSSILRVGAAIIFFLVVITVLSDINAISFLSKPFLLIGLNEIHAEALLTGLIEMTNGCSLLSGSIYVCAPIAAALLSFGGVCIYMQSLMFCSIRPLIYFSIKASQSVISYFLCKLVLPLFYVSNEVFAQIEPSATLARGGSVLIAIAASVISSIVFFIVSYCSMRRKLSH